MSAYLLLADQLEAQARAAREQAQTLDAQAKAIREMVARPVQTPAVARTLSVSEVAARLQTSGWFVRSLIRRGELKAVRFSGRALRVAESDVVGLIRKRTA